MKQSRRAFLKTNLSLGALLCLPILPGMSGTQKQYRVFIIGDSISMGYMPFLKKQLADVADVSRPDENCGATERGLAKLDTWLGANKFDIIHFNFGLHDLKHVDPVTKKASAKPEDPVLVDLKTYGENLETLVSKMKATGARLIFATTTPVPPNSGSPLREPDQPEKYNAVAKKIMKKHKVVVNDLYGFALPQLSQIQRPNNVHYTEAGYEILAGQVAKSIREVIAKMA